MADDVEIRVRVADRTEPGFRSVDGRLRDMRGRFAREGAASGDSFSDGLSGAIMRAGPKAEAALGGVLKAFSKLGAAGSALQAAPAIVGTLSQVAGAALLIPAAAGAAAFAINTLKVGMSGFGDALKSMDDPAKFAEALGKLAPQAREAAVAIKSLQPAWKSLKLDVQNALFSEMGLRIQKLGKMYLPQLKGAMVSVASGFNEAAHDMLDFFDSAEVAGDVGEMFGNFGDAINNVTKGLPGLGKALYMVMRVGSDFLPGLTSGFADLTDRLADYVTKLRATGQLHDIISNALSTIGQLAQAFGNLGGAAAAVFRGLSDGLGPGGLTGNLVTTTAALRDFLNTDVAQSGLSALGEMLSTVSEVTRTVFLEALKQIAPILVDLAPSVETVARTIGDVLVGALRVVGPLLDGFAKFLADHQGLVATVTTVVLGLVAAYRGLLIAQAVSGAIAALNVALGGTAAAGAAAGAGAGAAARGIGLLKGAAAAVGVGILAKELDDANTAARGANDSMGVIPDTLHNIVGAFTQLTTSPGSVFTEIGDEWNQLVMKFQSGQSAIGAAWGEFTREMSDFHLEPISVSANIAPAKMEVDSFRAAVNSSGATVSVNGNTQPAGDALANVLGLINAGAGTVTVNGNTLPANDALAFIQGVINTSAGTVDVNGDTTPAGLALTNLLARYNSSVGTITGRANVDYANRLLDWAARSRTAVITASVGGNIGGRAMGGIIGGGGGLTMVGEHGPELVRGMASGGISGRGVRLVGERGPELLRMPAGSSVIPDGQTRRIMSEPPAPQGGGAVEVRFTGNTDGAFATAFMRLVRTGQIQVVTS